MIREPLLIEEEARNLKLDQVAAIPKYFGGDLSELEMAKSFQDKWFAARSKLMVTCPKIFGPSTGAPDSEGAMRKGRFTEEQMVTIIREGGSRTDVCSGEAARRERADDLHPAQAVRQFFEVNDVRRLRQLEAENARLKNLVVERDLEIKVVKEVASKNW